MSSIAHIAPDRQPNLMGAGDFIPWDGGCLLIVRATRIVPIHAHNTIQIGLGAEHGIRFRTDDQAPWTEYRGAMIPSRQPHAIDATRVSSHAMIFVDSATPAGRALHVRCATHGIVPLEGARFESAATKLFATWRRLGNSEATRAAAREVVGTMTDSPRALPTADERFLRAIDYINGHLDAPLTLASVANAACLSPGRFRHLFVEQTGTALRAYILWRRFVRAWEAVVDGASVSGAAHLAGFADAAHFTRTSQRMFGFPPSALRLDPRRWQPGSLSLAS